MKASDWVAAAWLVLVAVFWSAAGWAAANGLIGAAFAYAIAPFAFMSGAGLVMLDLDKRRVREKEGRRDGRAG